MFKELDVELAIFLHNSGVGIYGTATDTDRTIFTGELPSTLEKGVALLEPPSPEPHKYIDTEYRVIDFWTRAPHTDEAKALAREIHEIFYRKGNFSLGTWYVYFAKVLGSIVDMDRDTNGGKLFRLSIQFICRNTNHIS